LQPEARENYDIVIVDSLSNKAIGNATVQLYNDEGVQFFNGTSMDSLHVDAKSIS